MAMDLPEMTPLAGPPYYAVIFTSTRTPAAEGYADMADEIVALAKTQEGFLGIDSARNNVGITVSYWRDEESIRRFKAAERHLLAQGNGRKSWYSAYSTRVCKVEREYSWERAEDVETLGR